MGMVRGWGVRDGDGDGGGLRGERLGMVRGWEVGVRVRVGDGDGGGGG